MPPLNALLCNRAGGGGGGQELGLAGRRHHHAAGGRRAARGHHHAYSRISHEAVAVAAAVVAEAQMTVEIRRTVSQRYIKRQ